jgi:predicted dehydrogenase
MPTSTSRRHFLKASGALSAWALLPAHVALGQQSSAGLAPSERVNLAVIGIGNRGGAVLKNMVASGLCNIVALCDVDMKGAHVQEALTAHPNAPRFQDFRKLFDTMADEIDAVLIATPDHAHFCATMLAMSLGKHVYVEKPLAHTFGECARLMEMEKKTGVVTQVGNQGHSGANYFQFKAWSEAGIIKDVTKITAHMNNSRRWHGWGTDVTEFPDEPIPAGLDWEQWFDAAPERPFSARLHPQEWRSWYIYGSGAFGDWGPHILDTCHRFLDLGLPEKVTAVKREGINEAGLVYPQASTIRFSFPARAAMPPCEVTWYDGVDNKPSIDTSAAEGLEPQVLDDPGKVLYSKDLVFQGGSHGSPLRIIPREKLLDMRAKLPRFSQRNSNHYENFLLACKGEEAARSPFSVGAPLNQVFNLGIITQMFGGELRFDRETKQIIGDERASAFLDPAPRAGWEEYYRLHV